MILSGGGFSATRLLWGEGLAVLDVVCACWLFARIFRHAVRSGLIARCSAETVSQPPGIATEAKLLLGEKGRTV